MRHEKLFEPVDTAEPCGPDLDELGDEDYLNYVLPAEDRLPARFTEGQFYGSASNQPFDRSTIDLKSEVGNIAALLERTRDLRLLALEARFQVVAGQVAGFAESIQTVARLLGQYWDAVHPVAQDGDFTLRQNTLASLDDRVKVILPLQFAAIVRDKKLGPISYRHYAVASGAVPRRADEAPLQPDVIVAALGAEENRQAAEAAHAAVTSAAEGLNVIRAAFIDQVGHASAPSFDGLAGALGEIAGLIEKALPALVRPPAPAEPETGAPEAAGLVADTGAESSAGAVAAARAVHVGSQREAAAALEAAEDYFRTCEPSAPALILVRQARQLIGKPLVFALEALAPQAAERALIRFEGPPSFQLDIGRMRQLTAEALAAGEEPAATELPSHFAIASRADAAALIAGVEGYFRRAEPSSPTPMLLARARSFMDQDFLSIVRNLTAAEGQAAGG